MKCVFRIIFSDGRYWVSATGDYLSAIEYHSGYFSRGSHPSKIVREAYESSGDYEFEVLGKLPDSASRRLLDVAKQTFLEEGDPMCINRKKGVMGPKNYKTDEHRRRKREEYRRRVRAQGKEVRSYTRRGI